MSTYTITLGDCAENGVGMEQIGTRAARGWTPRELRQMQRWWEEDPGVQTELHHLGEEAWVLVVRGGLEVLAESGADGLLEELSRLDWDRQALMRGRVVNKRARYNLCWAEESREPDYAAGRGRLYGWSSTPVLAEMRETLHRVGLWGDQLQAEGNYYWDISRTGIGYHGDRERRRVIGLRVGATMPIAWCWYQHSARISEPYTIHLHHGDLYVMSEKAAGTDWLTRKIPTLRHAAGCAHYTR